MDKEILGIIILIVIIGSLLTYVTHYILEVVTPAENQEKQLVKNMDCKTIKLHLVWKDLQYTTIEDLEATFIGRCT